MPPKHNDDWQKYLDEWEKHNDPANFFPDREFSRPANEPRVEEDFFSLTFPEAAAVGNETEGELTLDVLEDDANLYVIAPISGCDKNNLEVAVENDILTIKGERKHSIEESTKNKIYQECFWGKFSRSIVLPKPVDETAVRAQLKQGVLTIILPKKSFSDKINIDVNEE